MMNLVLRKTLGIILLLCLSNILLGQKNDDAFRAITFFKKTIENSEGFDLQACDIYIIAKGIIKQSKKFVKPTFNVFFNVKKLIEEREGDDNEFWSAVLWQNGCLDNELYFIIDSRNLDSFDGYKSLKKPTHIGTNIANVHSMASKHVSLKSYEGIYSIVLISCMITSCSRPLEEKANQLSKLKHDGWFVYLEHKNDFRKDICLLVDITANEIFEFMAPDTKADFIDPEYK